LQVASQSPVPLISDLANLCARFGRHQPGATLR
jgi:hypothetical protein